jgi:hypothetical protein
MRETTAVWATECKSIDEQRSRPVRASQATFKHRDVKRERGSVKLGRHQCHHSIGHVGTFATEHRNGGVGRVFGKAVLSFIPLHDELFGRHMPSGPNRPISEHNCVRSYSG